MASATGNGASVEATLVSRMAGGKDVPVRVSFPAEHIARIRIGSDRDVSPLPTLKLPRAMSYVETDNGVAGGGLTVTLDPERFDLKVRSTDGRALISTSTQDMTQKGAMRVEPVEFTATGVAASFRVEPDDRFLGFGEKFCNFDKRGLTIVSSNSNAGGATSEAAYKNVPFFINTRGYGVLFNTSRSIRHDIAEPGLSILSYRAEVYASELDILVIDGPDPKSVLRRYCELTGFAPVAPLWSYGVWMCRFYFENWQTLNEAANGYRERGIPCDVVAPDSYWHEGHRLADVQWDESRFPKAGENLTDLRRRGFRTCLWLYPYLSEDSPLFQGAYDNGFLCTWPDGSPAIVPTTLPMPCHDQPGFRGVGTLKHIFKHPIARPGALIDFTNPEAVNWYKSLLDERFAEGVSVFKTDFGEDVPDDVRFHDGRSGRDVHNIYPMLFQQVVAEATAARTGDFIIWGRSGWAGSQAHPVHWGGDPTTSWQAMSASLRAGLSYGLSGIPYWSHDIGGFAGPAPSEDLFVRWAQFGLLSSHSRFHGTTPREPWEFGTRATAITRDFARLRMRLLPYLYDLGRRAHETGIPVMRALWLEFPDDPGARLIDTQFMLGDALLVCPVFNARGDIDYYLPGGDARWIDLRNGRRVAGGRWQTETRLPLENMPVFMREGAILPLIDAAKCTDECDWSTLALVTTENAESSYRCTLPDGRKVELDLRRAEGDWIARLSGIDRIRLAAIGSAGVGGMQVTAGRWTPIDTRKERLDLSAYTSSNWERIHDT